MLRKEQNVRLRPEADIEMKPQDLVARFATAAVRTDPMVAVRAELEQLKDKVAEVEEALRYISGIGGNARQVFYRSPDLTLLKVCFPAGRRTPPHDHGTWATILLLSGEEKNTLYRVPERKAPQGKRNHHQARLDLGHARRYSARRRMCRQCTYRRTTCLWRRHFRTSAPHVASANAARTSLGLDAIRNLRTHCVRGTRCACGVGPVLADTRHDC